MPRWIKDPRSIGGAVAQGLAAMGLGMFMFLLGVFDARFAWDMHGFREAEAKVIAVDASAGRWLRLWSGGPKPLVWYEFDVHGRCIRGDRYQLRRPRFGTTGEAVEHLRRAGYSLGATVPVFYDPADPNRNILSREMSGWWFFETGGVTLFGASLAVWGGQRVVRVGVSRPYRERLQAKFDRKRARA